MRQKDKDNWFGRDEIIVIHEYDPDTGIIRQDHDKNIELIHDFLRKLGYKQKKTTSQSAKSDQPTNSCDIMECDPEGMKPKSKYEKSFRDVK